MSLVDDEFDLDLRLSTIPREPGSRGLAHGDVVMRDEQDDDTVAPQATCPADTCDVGCQTDDCTFGCPTHGCNTDTCDQGQCSDAITFGDYCEDASGGEDTCHQCPGPGGEPPDNPDVPDSPALPGPNP